MVMLIAHGRDSTVRRDSISPISRARAGPGYVAAKLAKCFSPDPSRRPRQRRRPCPEAPSGIRQKSFGTKMTRVRSPSAASARETCDALSTSVSSCHMPVIIHAEVQPVGVPSPGGDSSSTKRAAHPEFTSLRGGSPSRAPQQIGRYRAVDRRDGGPDDAGHNRSPVAHVRLEHGGRRRNSSGHEKTVQQRAGSAQSDVVMFGGQDLPAQNMVRSGERCQFEPQHVSMRNQHDDAQPLRSVLKTGPNHLLRRPGIGVAQRDLECVSIVASFGGYDRSPLYDSHFRPIPFSMRGYTIR